MGCKLEEYGPRGRVPECGAIFMANRETKKECLKMEMFALPSGSTNFVKQVKAGMLLFLFEYEKRQLFGVYRATTDGGINILSQGSRSSLTQYPAQVWFTPVWFCDPLSEKEFKDAIKENYFASRKFNFGLSEDQLLQLFSSRKLKNELQPKQLRDSSEPSHDLRLKLSKKLDAENREVRNGSPDLLSKDKGHFADRCKEEDNSCQYRVNVTNNTHSPNTFEQSGLPNNSSGSLSTKRRKEDNDEHPMNLKDQQSVYLDVPGPNFCGGYSGDTLDGNKRTEVNDDGNFVKLKDQRSVRQDVPGLNFRGEYCGDTSESKKRRKEDSDMYSMNLNDQKSVHEDVSGINVYGEHHGDTLDSNTLDNDRTRKEDYDRYLMKLKDQRSVHHDVCAGYNGDTLDTNKRTKEEDDRYLMKLQDQQSGYPDVPTLNFGSEYHGDLLDKRWQPSDCDDEYFPVPINPRVASNDMYTFVDRAVADIEQDGRPSSNSPLIHSENFAFGAKGLSDGKSYMNLGSKRTYELCNSHQDVLLSEISGDTKCSQPEFHYLLNDTKCLTRDMQNMDHFHRPDVYMNSASVDEWKYRPRMNGQFDSEHYLGASHEPGYSFGELAENTIGVAGVTDDGLDIVSDGRVKAGHSGEPIWSSELHGNSSRSYIPSRRSSDTKHNQDEGSAAMGSFHNSVASFGYGSSCQPNEDPSMYCEGSHPIKKNQLSEAQHLFHTYPSYHESWVTESVPCDSDVNYSHPVTSSSPRVFTSSSLLRGIPPYCDSGEPHVSNSRSLLYHSEEDHLSKFPYEGLKNQDKLQCSTSANQDYYLGDTYNCFQNTVDVVNRELGNVLPTNRRSPLVATSPSGNKRLPEDVVCSEEEIRYHALSPHKNLSVNYDDSVHPSHVCEHMHDKSSAGQFPNVNWSSSGYPSGKDLKNYDSERHVSQGQVMGQGNDNAQHPIDVSGIPKSNRRSVFARLSSGPEISSREKLDSDQLFGADTTVDALMDTLLQDIKPQQKKQGKGKSQKLAKHVEETPYSDRMLKAVDEVMSMLPQIKKSLVKMPGEPRKLAAQPDEEVPITEENLSLQCGHLMIDSSEDHANYLNIADGECPDDTLRETRLVQFKRRSETKKNLGERTAVEVSMGKKEVDTRTADGSTKLSPFKCRKLVRPAFVVNKSVAEGMETKPKMQDPPQSPVKDTPRPERIKQEGDVLTC